MPKIVKLEEKVPSDVAEDKLTPQEISDDDEEEYERYIPVEQSIIIALNQVREMQAGRLPKKSWREFFKELRAEDESEEREKINEKRRINA